MPARWTPRARWAGWLASNRADAQRMTVKLKTIEVEGKVYAEVQDGKPVYVEDDGKELAFDAVGTRTTISRQNGQAKTHRERAEAAEGKGSEERRVGNEGVGRGDTR